VESEAPSELKKIFPCVLTSDHAAGCGFSETSKCFCHLTSDELADYKRKIAREIDEPKKKRLDTSQKKIRFQIVDSETFLVVILDSWVLGIVVKNVTPE